MDLMSEDEFFHRVQHVPTEQLKWNLANRKKVKVWIRRDDLIDPIISGNKFYKLFYNLLTAKNVGYTKILSFGGYYSNHLYALAAAGFKYGFDTVGVIRGERPKQFGQTLKDIQEFGMTLDFISRENYREKKSLEMELELRNRHGDFFMIPEGGSNREGALGAKVLGSVIVDAYADKFNAVCLATGTGSTLAGVAMGMGSLKACCGDTNVIGFSALKGDGNLGRDINEQVCGLGNESASWRLISGFHAGGYGKKLPSTLENFIKSFENETAVMLDPVYTAKMCWGVAQLLEQNYWPSGCELLLVHTGGLQGRRGFCPA